jgi:hypothetical protein
MEYGGFYPHPRNFDESFKCYAQNEKSNNALGRVVAGALDSFTGTHRIRLVELASQLLH